MTVSATCAIIAVVQTAPNRRVDPPEPTLLSCICTSLPVAFRAGNTPRMAAAMTVRPAAKITVDIFRPGLSQNGTPVPAPA